MEKNGPPEAEPAELGEAVGVLARTLRCATVPNPMMGCFLMEEQVWHVEGDGGEGGGSQLVNEGPSVAVWGNSRKGKELEQKPWGLRSYISPTGDATGTAT